MYKNCSSIYRNDCIYKGKSEDKRKSITSWNFPGSININVLDEQFAVVADSTLRKDAPVALYCRSGKRSKKAAAILSKKGYTVYELDKGFTGWKQAGKETEK